MALAARQLCKFSRGFSQSVRRLLTAASLGSRSWAAASGVDHAPVLARLASTTVPLCEKKEVKVTFVRASGERIEAKGKVGDSLLDMIVNNEIDLDGYGACEGTLTCSTCHVILSQKDYDRLPEKPTDEELDMLDLAYELSDTSRLGCQIMMTEELNGLEVKVPATINDARS